VRPDDSEYAEYYRPYVALVPDVNVVDFLTQQLASATHILQGIDEGDADFRYAEGKWSIKEVVGHLCDSERVFGCRALRFARGDDTPLPGFDQDRYVASAQFERRILHSLAEELYNLRKANIRLFRSLSDAELSLLGTANDARVTVRALMYIIAGHAEHHVNVIKERYLVELG
jgi:hypothetical protein